MCEFCENIICSDTDNGIVIECEYEKLKCDKCGCPIVKDNELVKEKHIVRI